MSERYLVVEVASLMPRTGQMIHLMAPIWDGDLLGHWEELWRDFLKKRRSTHGEAIVEFRSMLMAD